MLRSAGCVLFYDIDTSAVRLHRDLLEVADLAGQIVAILGFGLLADEV